MFVPGPAEPGSPLIFPRPPLPRHLTAELASLVPSASFLSNPARIQYCTQHIVLFRYTTEGHKISRRLMWVISWSGLLWWLNNKLRMMRIQFLFLLLFLLLIFSSNYLLIFFLRFCFLMQNYSYFFSICNYSVVEVSHWEILLKKQFNDTSVCS